MTAIRIDTDELKRLSQRMEQEVAEPLRAARNRVAATLNRIGLGHPGWEEFSYIAGPIIRNVTGAFPRRETLLAESQERLLITLRYFEEVDGTTVGRMAAMRADFPEWIWNKDFALCLMMDMTLEELAVFAPYGNLLGGNPRDGLSLLLSVLRGEIQEVLPGSLAAQAANTLLPQLDILKIKPGTLDAEMYLLARNPADILPGSKEEEVYIQCVECAYSVKFDGKWPAGLRLFVAAGVKDVGDKCGEELQLTGPEAFRKVYATGPDDHMFFIWGTALPKDSLASKEGNSLSDIGRTLHYGGCTTNKHLINYASISNLSSNRSILEQEGDTSEVAAEKLRHFQEVFQNGRNTSAHELGHAFCHLWTTKTGAYLKQRPDNFELIEYSKRLLLLRDEGFQGHKPDSGHISLWRQHPPCSWDPSPASGEYFADMFLGWVHDAWAEPGTKEDGNQLGNFRKEFMNGHMPAWLSEAQLQPGANAKE